MEKSRNRYKNYQTLRNCPVCNREYDEHWKVVNHIRKMHGENHQIFLKQQEKEVFDLFMNNTGRVEDLADNLYKNKNIFSGMSYGRIDEILEKYIQKEEIKVIQKKRISVVMKTVPKTALHNQRVSDGVKKAWVDGKFDTKEYKQAQADGYKNGKSQAGKNNPMYGKPAPKGSGRGRGGIRPDIGHYVRSTWEANMCRICQYMKREYKFEPDKFFVVIDGVDLTYTPDLYFPVKNFYYETKGHAKSSSKWICICDSCILCKKKIAAARKQYGIKIIVIGNEEYKKFKRRFIKFIPNWEK